MQADSSSGADRLLGRHYRRLPPDTVASLLAFRMAHHARSLDVEGRAWEFLCAGQGERALLLLHGLAGACDVWWQQIEALRASFRIVSLTYPAVDTLEGLRGGVNAVLAALGVGRFAVVGTSLGGYLAQYLLARQPERIERAVLANTFPPNPILARRTRGADRLIRLVPQALLMAGMRWNTRLSIYPASGRSELLKAYLDEATRRSLDKRRFLARYRAAVEWFDPPDPAARGIPVLILESANDPLIDSELRGRMRQTYPSARVHTFGAVGHFPYINQPRAYTEVLAEFLLHPP